jgi:hypothetical protein
MLQHVSIIIQIIFRELVGSLLKSLNLKVFVSFLKLWRLFVVMRHIMFGVCAWRSVWRGICLQLISMDKTLICSFQQTRTFNFFVGFASA